MTLSKAKNIDNSYGNAFNLVESYKEIWRFKSFLLNWTKRELEIRYKGSILGILWNFLQPLLSLSIYFFLFSRLLGGEIDNYLIYLYSGIISWIFFLQTISQSPLLFVSGSAILKKIYFPSEILSISVVFSGLINYFISFFIIIVLMFFTEAPFSLNLLWVPLIAILQAFFIYSTVLLISSLTVFIRDLNQIVSTILNMLFFLTPVIYKAEVMVPKYASILNSTPIAAFLTLFRDVIYEATHPSWMVLSWLSLFCFIWYLFCHFVFIKLRSSISDLI
ncbi:MAG: ABC transporter permease [Candidatus Caenarcaniphilales bacterium]|nr:ABC transporter permease [Candidatus Caenarcaniphilales bacterium]